jgi:hypothetical protein
MANENVMQIFDRFSAQEDVSQVVACARGFARDVTLLIRSPPEWLDKPYRREIEENGEAKTAFDNMSRLPQKLEQATPVEGRITSGDESERRIASREYVEKAAAIFDEYRKYAAAITDRCPQAGVELEKLLRLAANAIIESEDKAKAIRPEDIPMRMIARRILKHASAPQGII